MQKSGGKPTILRGLTPRVVSFALAFWIVVGATAQATGLVAVLSRFLTEPAELNVRAWLQRGPRLEPKLKIFTLDDSTFAHIAKPALSGAEWAGIVRALTKARPRAIVTTHMFGTGEMEDGGGVLGRTLDAAKAQGIDLVAGAFAYPGAIKYREPVPLDVFSFVKASPDLSVRARDSSGWNVYGPDPAAARRFSRLGHQGYEGDGRAALLVRVGARGETLVPHLALAVAHNLRATETGVSADGVDVPLDAAGRTRIDLLSPAELAASTKSLKALLKDADEGATARYVEAGDVVLLLMDMYTGKVNFAPTPKGSVPGGYLWAALINSLLSQRWIREAPGAWAVALVVPAVGAALGVLLEGALFGVGLGLAVALTSGAGLTSFALRGVALPWMPALLLLVGTAASLFALKHRLRLAGARGRQIAADREAARLSAIVRTAQMFAHDVRKPFSLLNMALVAMKRETNPARAGALLAGLAPELSRAMASVEGMIRDIMEIDSDAKLDPRATDLGALVRQAMKDVLASRPKAEVLVSFRLRHTLPAEIDAPRLTRAVMNIMDNAVQATGGKGRVWVDTVEVLDKGRCFIQLVVGNSGSFVPVEDRARVFDAFFTKGKKDGTGLGLAIAHKIVAGHGGRVWCDAVKEIGTEFFMTLPVAQATPREVAAAQDVPEQDASSGAAGDEAPGDARVPADAPLYAVIDDNAFVLEAWETIAAGETILTFRSPESFLKRADAEPGFLASLTAVVTDFHFEGTDVDGLELARQIKARRKDCPIFLSTDGDVEYLPGDGIDARIAKEPRPFAELLTARSRSRSA